MITTAIATNADVEAIYDLGQNAPEFHVSDGTTNFWPREILRRATSGDDAVVLIAKDDDVLIGFIIANCNKSLGKVLIENIYVAPQARGRGVGSLLLAELLRTVKTNGYEYIATLVSDETKAIHVYKQAGFVAGDLFRWLDIALSGRFRS